MAENQSLKFFLIRARGLLASEPYLSLAGLFVVVPLAADFVYEKAQNRGWV